MEPTPDKQDPRSPAPGSRDASLEEADPLDQDLDAPDDEPAPSRADESPAGSTRPTPSRKDAIWIGVLGLFLLVLVIYAYGVFKAKINTVGRPDDADFPVKGAKVVIGKIQTYWRRPDLEQDRAKLGVHLIPCADVTLKSGSGEGRLRFFFEDADGNYVGDPVTMAFSGGKFDSTGAAEGVLNATDGFEHEGQYNAYIPEQVHFWHLNVFEGPPASQQDGEFEKLVRVRISKKRR